LIENQLRIAKIIVASVPSVFYSTKDRGDERLMSIEEWRKVLKNFGTFMFYYGFKPRQPDRIASLRFRSLSLSRAEMGLLPPFNSSYTAIEQKAPS
jgi:hypothetical protein